MGLTPRALAEILKADFLFTDKEDAGEEGGDTLGYSLPPGRENIRTVRVRPDGPPGTKHIDVERDMPQVTILAPFSRGGGWRGGASPWWWDEENALARYSPPPEGVGVGRRKKDGSYPQNEQEWYDKWEAQVIPDIIDTIAHEMGHAATQGELRSLDRNATSAQFPPIKRYDRGLGFPDKIGRDKPLSSRISDLMAREMDNPRLERIRRTAERNPAPTSLIGGGWRRPHAWDERAAYTAEFPDFPGYAKAKWLNHSNVEQAQRRKALNQLAAAQKKWGYEPIDAKGIADDLRPKRWKWDSGRDPWSLRAIMGDAPPRRPPMPLGERVEQDWMPDESALAQQMLLPPEERIYRNLLNAIMNQGAGIASSAHMFQTDPEGYMNRGRSADRRKGVEQIAGDAIRALNRHFKAVNQGDISAPRSIQDLPEDLRGEIGRLELRRILANMVNDQFKVGGYDWDWDDPDMAITHDWRKARGGGNRKRVRDLVFSDHPREWDDEGYPLLPSDPAFAIKQAYNQKLKEWWDEHGDEWRAEQEAARDLPYDESGSIEVPKTKYDADFRSPTYRQNIPDGTQRIRISEHMAREKARKRTKWQNEILEQIKQSGASPSGDYIYWDRRYPEMMLADRDFVTFDPDNPIHQQAIEWADEKGGSDSYDTEDYWPSNLKNARNIFPSLYYGLLPKEALERTMPEDPESSGLGSDVHYESQFPDRRNVLADWEHDKIPEEGWPDFELKPHPLAGKPIMEQFVSGFAHPERWEIVPDASDALKRGRGYYGNDTKGRKAGVIRSPIDQDAELQRIMEEQGIDRSDAMAYLHGDYDTAEGISYKRKGSRGQREQPKRLERLPDYLTDPVTRAIAQAFMDKEMEYERTDEYHPRNVMEEKNRDNLGEGAFGMKPFGSERNERDDGWQGRHRPRQDLGDYMEGTHKGERKTLNEILEEISERRLKERGYDSWEDLDDALELEDEED